MTSQTIYKLITDLKTKQQYSDFKKQYPDSYLYAVFYSADFSKYPNIDENITLDFFLPSEKQAASFTYPFIHNAKIHNEKIENINKQNTNINTDINNIEEEIQNIKNKNKIQKNHNKTIAVLKDNIWNITCINPDMTMLRINLDAISGKCTKIQQENLMDFIRFKKGNQNK